MRNKVSLLFLFTASSLFSMDDYKINASLSYSPIVLDGHQKLGDGVSNISFSRLGIKDSEATLIPTIELVYENKHKLFISLISLQYNNQKTLTEDITKSDYTYITDTNINTRTDTTFISTGYRNIIGDIGYGFDINSYRYSVSISDKLNSTSIENSFVFPTLSIDVSTKIKKYNFDYGASVGEGSDMNYFKFYFSGGFDFEYIKHSNISLGYKQSEFYINDGIYETFHRYKGPYLNLHVKF